MEVSRILAEIDSQILKLQQARQLLSGSEGVKRAGPGRPKGSKNAAPAAPPAAKKRKLTAEAMKRRWAERKKAAPKA